MTVRTRQRLSAFRQRTLPSVPGKIKTDSETCQKYALAQKNNGPMF
ncbi:hypothetical protein LTSEWAN_5312 [Salmonella enterica subsp. enterica serovar Wandsworth str. A4-580]|uniref:Uncharacterized protein n=1 Tax=Salmonella enterica subsp. enterica serovar Wandsworth str. A4-580 TaxID=913086 RepID=G5SI27_SALET|nr:hypothetical protein LTSEWAN_5312 [Salmonella enterica subsp. enterica serovar Wandsworth str. A4-580]